MDSVILLGMLTTEPILKTNGTEGISSETVFVQSINTDYYTPQIILVILTLHSFNLISDFQNIPQLEIVCF